MRKGVWTKSPPPSPPWCMRLTYFLLPCYNPSSALASATGLREVKNQGCTYFQFSSQVSTRRAEGAGSTSVNCKGLKRQGYNAQTWTDYTNMTNNTLVSTPDVATVEPRSAERSGRDQHDLCTSRLPSGGARLGDLTKPRSLVYRRGSVPLRYP